MHEEIDRRPVAANENHVWKPINPAEWQELCSSAESIGNRMIDVARRARNQVDEGQDQAARMIDLLALTYELQRKLGKGELPSTTHVTS